MREINPASIQEIMNEFHVDYAEEVNQFSQEYPEDIIKFCELITQCFKKHRLFDRNKNPSQKESLTASYVYSTIDNIYTSAKLLAIGFIVPSGNMYRQSIESICMAILMSSPFRLVLSKNGQPTDFLDAFENDNKLAWPFKALEHLERNADLLEIDSSSLEKLLKTKDFYNNFSHSSKLAVGLRTTGSGEDAKWIIGGGIGFEDLEIVQKEFADRIAYTEILPDAINEIYERVK